MNLDECSYVLHLPALHHPRPHGAGDYYHRRRLVSARSNAWWLLLLQQYVSYYSHRDWRYPTGFCTVFNGRTHLRFSSPGRPWCHTTFTEFISGPGTGALTLHGKFTLTRQLALFRPRPAVRGDPFVAASLSGLRRCP